MSPARRLAVLGSPIAHSSSPRLHAAAYDVLGLDWVYGRVEVGRGGLAGVLEDLGPEWHGLSLTMPLKEEAFALAAERDEAAAATGAVNTLLLADVDGGHRGLNTDVPGIVDAFAGRGVDTAEAAVVIGAGATARSVVLALRRMGVTRVEVRARRFEAAAEIADFAVRHGAQGTVAPMGDALVDPALVVSTLPGDAAPSLPPLEVGSASQLFDVAYSDLDSAVRRWWRDAGGREAPVDGLDMLIGQAVRQVRAFVTGDAEEPLPLEADVNRAMRAAVGRS